MKTVTPTYTVSNSSEYDNSELVRIVRQGFEAVIKKMDSSNKEQSTPVQAPREKKPFQTAALYTMR